MDDIVLDLVVAGLETTITEVVGHAGTVIVAALAIFALIWGVRIILKAVRSVA
jgi:hypothetical protein